MKRKIEIRKLPIHPRCSIITFFVVIITSLLSAQGFAEETDSYDNYYDNYGLGIFQLRSQSPGPSLRFVMPNILPDGICSGWGTYVGSTWTNTWADRKNYTMDYEMLDVHAAISYCVSSRFELGFFLENRSFFGGKMDNTIEEFHDLFGIDQDGRDEVKHNKSRVILRDDQGNVISEFNADKLENNGVGLIAQYVIHPGNSRWPVISVNGQLRYALKEPEIMTDDDEPLDLCIGTGLYKRLGEKWYTYFHLGYTYYGQTKFDGLEFEDNSISGMVAVAYEWSSRLSIIGQYIFHEGVIKDLDKLSDYSHEVILGFKWMMDHGGIFELGLIENIIETNNSPDVGLHFAYFYRF